MRLKPGDKVGIISPSSPITATCPIRYKRAKAFIESKGLVVVEGTLTRKSDYYRSGSIKDRADEMNTFIEDKSISCIMSTIGGMNSNSLLPYLNYKALKMNPKIIVGYSDFTAILLGIFCKTGLITFYGPAAVATFGEFEPYNQLSFDYFMNIVGDNAIKPASLIAPEIWTEEKIDWESQDRSKCGSPNNWITVIPGKTEGRLIGGNLNTMQGIFGTEYMPEILDTDILFIEDSLKRASDIERSFSMLKCAGVFDKVRGIIYGKHELFDDQKSGRKPYEILLEVVGKTNIPILADFDCSHTHPMFTLPLGSRVSMDANNKEVTILE